MVKRIISALLVVESLALIFVLFFDGYSLPDLYYVEGSKHFSVEARHLYPAFDRFLKDEHVPFWNIRKRRIGNYYISIEKLENFKNSIRVAYLQKRKHEGGVVDLTVGGNFVYYIDLTSSEVFESFYIK